GPRRPPRPSRATGGPLSMATRKPRRTAPAKRRVLRAADLMSREPITVSEEMSIAELCDLFQEKNINGAPVVDRQGRLVGVVAQDDITYGAMGHADPIPGENDGAAGAGAGARGGRETPPPVLHRRRRVIARLRERTLAALPDAAPRPGERPFWAD